MTKCKQLVLIKQLQSTKSNYCKRSTNCLRNNSFHLAISPRLNLSFNQCLQFSCLTNQTALTLTLQTETSLSTIKTKTFVSHYPKWNNQRCLKRKHINTCKTLRVIQWFNKKYNSEFHNSNCTNRNYKKQILPPQMTVMKMNFLQKLTSPLITDQQTKLTMKSLKMKKMALSNTQKRKINQKASPVKNSQNFKAEEEVCQPLLCLFGRLEINLRVKMKILHLALLTVARRHLLLLLKNLSSNRILPRQLRKIQTIQTYL